MNTQRIALFPTDTEVSKDGHLLIGGCDAVELVKEGVIKMDLSGIHISETAEDSMALNKVDGPCMIIAGAGMCNAGRILHHLRHNLWKPETTVMIVGYQGDGSLGQRLLAGAPKVRIFGEEIVVKAHIASLGGLSAHAGQSDLVKWFGSVAASKPRLVLSHGEDRGRTRARCRKARSASSTGGSASSITGPFRRAPDRHEQPLGNIEVCPLCSLRKPESDFPKGCEDTCQTPWFPGLVMRHTAGGLGDGVAFIFEGWERAKEAKSGLTGSVR